MGRPARALWRWLSVPVGPYRCGSCDKPLRRLESTDLSPGAVRAHRLTGTLGGLLAAGYVCDGRTRHGCWILME